MSTTVMSDAIMMPAATESQQLATKLIAETKVEFVKCECCELSEECTPEYINRIRERYQGKWICGLCSEAVKYEIIRNKRLITTDEAMTRHMAFCKKSILSGQKTDPTVGLIDAMRQILRRSLDSPRRVRSTPCSPMRTRDDSVGLARSESCIPDVTYVVELEEMMNDQNGE
ncbi:hypothetical protein Tco_1149571 [Tanacetum coccineum]